MWLIAGLGNPGARYRKTRHNLGFMVLDALAERAGIRIVKERAKALIGRGRIGSREVVLAQPQTFMNLSGVSVARLMRHWRLKPESLIVAYDDLDLPFARIRLAQGGGAGGHKGVASIIEHLGERDFTRLRLGIGRPEEEGLTAADYVLRSFKPRERELLPEVISRGAEAVEAILGSGLAAAQTRFNRVVEA
jgi:PTH1 family peptidyl-tRNA hydrolase